MKYPWQNVSPSSESSEAKCVYCDSRTNWRDCCRFLEDDLEWECECHHHVDKDFWLHKGNFWEKVILVRIEFQEAPLLFVFFVWGMSFRWCASNIGQLRRRRMNSMVISILILWKRNNWLTFKFAHFVFTIKAKGWVIKNLLSLSLNQQTFSLYCLAIVWWKCFYYVFLLFYFGVIFRVQQYHEIYCNFTSPSGIHILVRFQMLSWNFDGVSVLL